MAEADTLHLEHVAQDVKDLKGDVRRLGEDVAELKGEMRQMTQRVSNVEQNQRQMMAILVGTWITTMLAIVGLYFKG